MSHGPTGAERERWERKWRERRSLELSPSAWVVSIAQRLPAAGRALDWAGGDGRHALWLASRGLRVTLADIAPTALATARERAESRGLAIETVPVDLALEEPPAGPWDLILCSHYLDRELPRRVTSLLAPGGLFVWVHPTRRNLERHERPPAHFLLEEGELPRLLAAARGTLEPVHLEEGWGEEGRHESRAIVRHRERP